MLYWVVLYWVVLVIVVLVLGGVGTEWCCSYSGWCWSLACTECCCNGWCWY